MVDPGDWDDDEAWTIGFESCRLVPYDDATGLPVPLGGHATGTLTAGYGHTGPDVVAGEIWTRARCNGAFTADYGEAKLLARRIVGPGIFDELMPLRRRALQDMCFNLGAPRFAAFHDMLAALRAGAWQQAHDAALASKWATQVPNRARADAMLLLTGVAPQAGT